MKCVLELMNELQFLERRNVLAQKQHYQICPKPLDPPLRSKSVQGFERETTITATRNLSVVHRNAFSSISIFLSHRRKKTSLSLIRSHLWKTLMYSKTEDIDEAQTENKRGRSSCLCLSESFKLFQIPGSLGDLSCASSNSGKKTNVESKATRFEMDHNGTPRSEHSHTRGKAMSLTNQLKPKSMLPI